MPRTVLAIVVVSAAQILLVAVSMILDLFQNPGSLAASAGVYAFWAIAAALVLLTCWQLLKARAWARSVLITWHLLVVFSFISIGSASAWTWVSVLGLGTSLGAFGLFMTPSARGFIQDRRAEMFED